MSVALRTADAFEAIPFELPQQIASALDVQTARVHVLDVQGVPEADDSMDTEDEMEIPANFKKVVMTKALRIKPTKWNNRIAMRVGVQAVKGSATREERTWSELASFGDVLSCLAGA